MISGTVKKDARRDIIYHGEIASGTKAVESARKLKQDYLGAHGLAIVTFHKRLIKLAYLWQRQLSVTLIQYAAGEEATSVCWLRSPKLI